MLKLFKYKIFYTYISIIVFSIFSAFFQETKITLLRDISYTFVLLFYFSIYLNWKVYNPFKLFKNYSLNITYAFYIIVCLVLLVFSLYKINSKTLFTLFLNPLSFSAFIIGIIGAKVGNFRKDILLQTCKWFNSYFILFMLFDFVLFKKPVCSRELSLLIILELLISNSLSKKREIYLLVISSIFFLGENFYDNRTSAFRGVGGILIYLWTTYFSFSITKLTRVIIFFLSVFLFVVITFSFQESFELVASYFKNSNTLNVTDTRSFLFIEFFQDFKNSDWIFGRGFLGTYFSQYFLDWDGVGGDSFQRFSVEIGFLDFLLKGGLLLTIPFFLELLLLVWRGLFNVSKLILKSSIFLLFEFILFGVENIPIFSIHFMVLWILIGLNRDEKQLFKYK